VSHDDPNPIYPNMKKIGEGAAGEVFLVCLSVLTSQATSSKNGDNVAIKKMPLNSQNMKLLITEVQVLTK